MWLHKLLPLSGMGNSDLFSCCWCCSVMEERKGKGKESGLVLYNVSVNSLHPESLVHSFPAESIEITIINAVYSNINFKLSLSVFLPFLRTSFGEISKIRRRVCFKFYARILHKYNQKIKLKSMRFYPWW